MTAQRQLWIWVIAAIIALAFLIGILLWERRGLEERWSTFLGGDPKAGARTFQAKGCGDCHAPCGAGTRDFPDLAHQRTGEANMNQLAVRLWNHLPAMTATWQAASMEFPRISPEEMANLFAYLYTACYVWEMGDVEKGRQLFARKNCTLCHSLGETTGKIGPNLAAVGPIVSPLYWSQAMWNHAPVMETHMREMNVPWPRFQGTEMNDLLTFLQEERAGPQREFELLPADPERGWELFRSKGCITCHSARGQGGNIGPDLDAAGTLPGTITQMAGEMWNHSPAMWVQMQTSGVERPTFQGQEMADLVAFLISLRSFDLGGSPLIGKEVFAQRKCSECHGSEGQGTDRGPELRLRGRIQTPVSLAQKFWKHGPTMLERVRQGGSEWPALKEAELAHLLAFLNTPRKAE